MSKYDNAGLVMIPSGYKASKVYSVIPNTADGDFDFARASTATRVNKDGLIEIVASGVPRLNYPLIDGVVQDCPALLLEPQRTNLLPYSEDLNGNFIGVTVLRNQTISPSGIISADKLSDNSSSGEHLINSNVTLSMVIGTSYSISAFFKADGTSGKGVLRYYNGSTFHYGIFNLDDGVVSYNSNGTSKMEAYSDGWYRCSISFTALGTYSNPPIQVGIGNSLNQFSYQGASSLGVSFWGVQFEQGSYPTSYIPTSGSTVTRVAETCNGAGNADTFNDSEGVLFAEISALADDSVIEGFSVNNGSSSDRAVIFKFNSSNLLRVRLTSNSVNVIDANVNVSDITEPRKMALKYKANESSFWMNGFQIFTVPSATSMPIGLNQLGFNSDSSSAPFYGNTKQLMTFNKALTDAELEDLTSWDSFLEMATSQLYTIS